jgi:hypothetical protein
MTSLEKALRDCAQFAAKLKGDEKSEAQTFLFHLLAAFGHDANTLAEGSTFDYVSASPANRPGFVFPPQGGKAGRSIISAVGPLNRNRGSCVSPNRAFPATATLP